MQSAVSLFLIRNGMACVTPPTPSPNLHWLCSIVSRNTSMSYCRTSTAQVNSTARLAKNRPGQMEWPPSSQGTS